jgi:hypothetical protein
LRRVLTSYYHVDEVRAIMRKHRAKVIPVDVEFHPETGKGLCSLPSSSDVRFVISREDFGHLSSQVTSFSQNKFGNTRIQVEVVSSGGLALEEVLRKKRHARVLVSNRIWDELSSALRSSRILRCQRLQITQKSVNSAWGGIGVI